MTCHLVLCLSQKTMWTFVFFSGGGGSVTNGILFHARVERFSPFLYSRSVAPLIPMECGHSSDFVLASPFIPRLPVFLESPYFS